MVQRGTEAVVDDHVPVRAAKQPVRAVVVARILGAGDHAVQFGWALHGVQRAQCARHRVLARAIRHRGGPYHVGSGRCIHKVEQRDLEVFVVERLVTGVVPKLQARSLDHRPPVLRTRLERWRLLKVSVLNHGRAVVPKAASRGPLHADDLGRQHTKAGIRADRDECGRIAH